FESHRTPRRGWRVSALQRTANSFDTDLLVFAYCDPDATQRAEVVKTTRSVPTGETRSAVAECARGTRAVAGGFLVPTNVEQSHGGFPIESRRMKRRTWRVTSFAPNPDGGAVTAYAYCASRPGKLRTRVGGRQTGGAGDYVEVGSARCPKPITARAGGFALPSGISPRFSIPVSVRDHRRWTVSVHNFGSPSSRLTSVAYCH